MISCGSLSQTQMMRCFVKWVWNSSYTIPRVQTHTSRAAYVLCAVRSYDTHFDCVRWCPTGSQLKSVTVSDLQEEFMASMLGLLYEYGGLTNLVEVSIPYIKRMFNTFEYMQDSWQLINWSIAKMASCVCSNYNYNFFTRWRFCQNETSVMRYEIRRCDLLYHTPMNNQSMKWKWKLSISTTTHDEPITRRSVT